MHNRMARKRFLALAGVIAALVSVSSCSASRKGVELKQAAKDKDLLIAMSGVQGYDSVNLQLKNGSKKEKTIFIPAGSVMSVASGDFQSMIVAADTEIVLAADEEKTVPVQTYSLNVLKSLPGPSESFDIVGYKKNKDPAIAKILSYLSSEAGRNEYPASEEGTFTVVQQAIWVITDKLGYDANMAYVVDSMMISTILQTNPMVITLFLDNADSITDEAGAQQAVFDLVKNKVTLHEKLKTVFAERYEEAVAEIKAEIEVQAGGEYRKTVNDFIGKTGLTLTY